MHPPIYIVFTTFPCREDAESLARRLVHERVAACATVMPCGRSYYTWEGEEKVEEESVMILKTTGPGLAALQERLVALHPYECPEFVAVEAASVTEPFANWVAEAVLAPSHPDA
jgi:periplasmic divalent cation tolerance protein